MYPTAIRSVLTLLFPRHQTRLIEQAGGEVAREGRADLWNRVRQPAIGMSTPEIRGYARAYAPIVAAAHVDQVLIRRSLKPAHRVRVLASSINQLVSMAVRDALRDDAQGDARPLAA